ncbi:Blue light- and temperature-regulated antirepressor BluF [Methylobacterium adhaesivum]|jgi:EAL domain-containing protein (putative c-di-GMP-specific phosphodiesterase class I)|uniref:EAL domain-containing protein n=1 Tax=Methylobacterium adhaesivum TaxID=333297 RepID=A0ABT8BER7_9HYPH|nr:EAL domain-containing protein [Methylobacterium adhaesivum]MDN3590324.1 EAL domain-containing protein [Methylobacterium adhaesivum]GJD30744.1 Blue light- and temperature-regulated antirepressor BluF [Methylobacterium adhaesivum]
MTVRTRCQGCGEGAPLDFTFTMAFQPILDLAAERIWGYEALVRGPDGQSAGSILDRVTPETIYRFDQAARVKAIDLAGRLFPADDETRLSINFMPNAVYEPAACIRSSLEAARRAGFAHDRIMFEFTENEKFRDTAHVTRIVTEYRKQGFLTALDDFGAGFAGLSLLTNFQPDLIKIDMDLLRGIDTDRRRQVIVRNLIAIAVDLDIAVIAEGVETAEELATLRGLGATLFQGYYFARPAVEHLPPVAGFPVPDPTAPAPAESRLVA